jgi:hypothetical protein
MGLTALPVPTTSQWFLWSDVSRCRYTHVFRMRFAAKGEVYHSTVSAHVGYFRTKLDAGENLSSPEGRSPERSEGEW